MIKTCTIFGFLVALAGVADAGPAVFTGAVSADLAAAENWSDGLPGAGDAAVVDFAVLNGANALTVSSDLALGGLVLSNVPPSSVFGATRTEGTVPSTVTLGADGLVLHRAAGADSSLTVNVNLATAAAQNWSLDNDTVVFNGTIAGTDPLTITTGGNCIHETPPVYGGKIHYVFPNSYQRARLVKKGVWAQDVQVDGARMELAFSEPATWREIFPGRRIQQSASTLLTTPGSPDITFEDGDSFIGTSGMLVVDRGLLTQNGGAITSSVQVGYAWYPGLYDMPGGTLKSSSFVVGNATTTEWATNQEFRLRGGAVMSGNMFLAWRGALAVNALAHNDVSISGGTLTLADGSDVDAGIHFAAHMRGYDKSRTDVSTSSSAFRQTGGTVKTPRVALGAHTSDDETKWTLCTNAYATLAVDGGTFDVGAGGFQPVAGRWNAVAPGDTEHEGASRYRFAFRGGTLAAYASFSSLLDLVFPTNDTPFTVDTRANDVTFAAPIWGSGNVEKKGTGMLAIADGTQHRGRIAVKEGVLKILGAPGASDTVPGEPDCWIWRADDAAAGLADGDEITAWPDATATRTAVYDGISKNNVAVTKPTAAPNAFNGHAGVAFNKSALKVAAADNPLAGATNWTICLVFKTSTAGMGSMPDWYQARGILGREEGGVVDDWGVVFDAGGRVGAGLGIFGGRDYVTYSSGGYADGRPHVVFYTLDTTGELTLSVDGEVVRRTVALMSADRNPRRGSDIYFGVQNIGDNGPAYYAFIGTIAEIRFYPSRTLTAGERAGLGATLAVKYGASTAVGGIGGADAQTGELLRTAVPTSLPEDGAAAWEADSIMDVADGASVTDWPSTDGARHATLALGRLRMISQTDLSAQVNGNVTAPTLVRNALNGHAVLRFAGSQALGVSADDSPVSGATSWTAAMVFRTTDSTAPGRARQFYMGCPLFGAELPRSTRADWGVTFWNEQGRLIAGYGGKNAGGSDKNIFSRAWDLNDGEPHILIATFDTTNGRVDCSVDGVSAEQSAVRCSPEAPREAMRVLIGSMNADFFFRGDIAAFRLYDRVLNAAERATLLAAWTDRFAVPPSARFASAVGASGRFGLDSPEITVSAGASLVLPRAETAPFVVTGGRKLAVAGSVKGVLAVGTAGLLDLSAAQSASLDDLWLKDGATVRLPRTPAAPLPLTSFRAEGAVTLELEGAGSLPTRVPLFTYSASAAVDTARISFVGAEPTTMLVVDETARQILLYTAKGSLLIFR